jgi:hypothetical protein
MPYTKLFEVHIIIRTSYNPVWDEKLAAPYGDCTIFGKVRLDHHSLGTQELAILNPNRARIVVER